MCLFWKQNVQARPWVEGKTVDKAILSSAQVKSMQWPFFPIKTYFEGNHKHNPLSKIAEEPIKMTNWEPIKMTNWMPMQLIHDWIIDIHLITYVSMYWWTLNLTNTMLMTTQSLATWIPTIPTLKSNYIIQSTIDKQICDHLRWLDKCTNLQLIHLFFSKSVDPSFIMTIC